MISAEDTPRKDGDICILPWKDFIFALAQSDSTRLFSSYTFSDNSSLSNA